MMFFNDVFMNDEFYINFGMTDDLMMSNVVGEGAQFEVKRFRLSPHMSVRTSNEASSRLTGGREVILKRPKLVIDSNTHKFKESAIIENVVQELRVISHPSLRHHRNILDVYGFAWEQEHYVPGVAVWPIIMVEFGELGTLDDCLSQSVPLNLDTKLRLAGDIAAGVDALHSCGIIHSDLKPENIIVCQTSDGTLIAKLSDFGYSIILGERESPSLWDTGTDGWMAPGWPLICENEELFSSDSMSKILFLARN
jgi:serine/threonine protein kinase